MKKILSLMLVVAIISTLVYLIVDNRRLYEPTHNLTDEQMQEVCIEEGIL